MLLSEKPYFVSLLIPADLYESNPEDVVTFGLLETIVVTEEFDEDSAYMLVKTVFENLDWLRSLHPALSELSADTMHREGLSVPLHPGALKYYREQGWVP